MAIDDDILQEFLTESFENLTLLDQLMVELEQDPSRKDLLAAIFRTVHTIKGTCGFLGFTRLEALTHVAEDVLNDLRQGRRHMDPALATLILEAADGMKRILYSIQAGEGEGHRFEDDVAGRLREVRDSSESGSAGSVAQPPETQGAPIEEVPSNDASSEEERDAALGSARPPSDPSRAASALGHSGLRVDVGLLDRLMNLVGELVLTRNQLLQFNSGREDSALNAISQRLNLITSELQESVMKTRMQPIGVVWNKLPRIVRDLARGLGKEVALEMSGADTELDRTIIEAIKDPLTHIVRNSCDHGIESPAQRLACGKLSGGRLALRAYHEGGQVNIEIGDDGAGIDPARIKSKAVERHLITAEQAARLSDREAVHLVFLPGFSTAEQVTNVSGRGVGMDVVKTHIERIGGTVEILSKPGFGTTVRVRIPLTLAIIPGLVVWAGGERFVIPQVNLHELIRLEGEEAKLMDRIKSSPVLRRRNALLPVTDLNEVLKLKSRRAEGEVSIVILQADKQRFGLIVDQIGDSQEIVVKPLGQQLKAVNCYAGATIMGDGRIALILDVVGVGLLSGVMAGSGQGERAPGSAEAEIAARSSTCSLLLCRAGSFQRVAIPLAQVARLENIPATHLEWAGGRQAIQYRERILPLVRVADVLGVPSTEQDNLPVIVYRNQASEFGLVVDEITDVLETSVGDVYPSDRVGVLGSAIIAERLTDFLDVGAVARRASVTPPVSLDALARALAPKSAELFPAEVEA
jgi:two-component system chemotaxis sensor kinase CheA